MKSLQLADIARMSGGRLFQADDANASIDAVSIDTRTLAAQNGRILFIALKGENFDGHEHLSRAVEAGAVAVMVSREFADLAVPQIVVANTELALAAWAGAMQAARATRIAALTGSNGKTSVKTLLLSILNQAGGAYANPGNLNNEIGLPLSVLAAPEEAAIAVYEMGAGKPGDIAYLTRVAVPDVSLVNNIAPAHLERMGSLLGVADTKAAIYDALKINGTAVINADDAFAGYFAERAQGRRVLRFALDASADVIATNIRCDADQSQFDLHMPIGNAGVVLKMPGRHNVANALAAASMAMALDMPFAQIVAGLENAEQVKGRLLPHRLSNGSVLIDDSYNANPGSLAAAIDTLAAAKGERWLVLGDMRELGDDAVALHAESGRRAKAAGIQRLYTLGELSAAAAAAFGEGAHTFESHAALAAQLAADLTSPVRILVKGSRGSAMDRIVNALLEGEDHAA